MNAFSQVAFLQRWIAFVRPSGCVGGGWRRKPVFANQGRAATTALVLLTGGLPVLASVGQTTPVTIAPVGDDQMLISWLADMLRPYQLETSRDLQTWTDEGPLRVGSGEILELLAPRCGPCGFYRFRIGAMRPGFDQIEMSRGDDHCYPQFAGSPAMVDLGFSINLFGTSRSACYVNNNGNITFDNPLFVYTPESLIKKQAVMIAPLWADVDSRNPLSGVTRFSDLPTLVDGRPAFGVTWRDVGYFSNHVDKVNSFQLLLIERADRNPGDFDIEFNYDRIVWETGDASGGILGFGGSAARVGWTNGSGLFMEYKGSGESLALLDRLPNDEPNFADGLIYQKWNSTVPGRILIPVVNGVPQTESGLNFSVNAGPDRILAANAGRGFDLSGVLTPPDAEGVGFSWVLESGSGDTTISNDNSLTPTVLIPEPGQYVFRLYGVKRGAFSASSSDTVTITHPGVFEIFGGSYTVTEGGPLAVVLDQAFARFNGQPVASVKWKQLDGEQTIIQAPNSIHPTVVLPAPGVYRFQLQASTNHLPPFVKIIDATVVYGN